MRDMRKRNSASVLIGLCGLALTVGMAIPIAHAQDATPAADASTATEAAPKLQKPAPAKKKAYKATSRKTVEKSSNRYFIEFRSRYALSYGHTFLAHGRLNARGEIAESEIA